MITGLGKVLENVDFIGKTINFRIDRSSSIKTSCGGVSSIIIMFLIFCIFYIFVVPFMNREDPDVTYYFKREVFPRTFNLTNDKFFLGYILEYENGDSISEHDINLIKVNLKNYLKSSNKNGEINPSYPELDIQSK